MDIFNSSMIRTLLLRRVKTFTEKPQIDLAKKFLESGDFVWNAGIFIWSSQAIINAFEKDMPELAETFSECNEHYFSENEQKFIGQAYSQSKNISIDYGIMGKGFQCVCNTRRLWMERFRFMELTL